jgi:uncharacterized HAD superfamily protein
MIYVFDIDGTICSQESPENYQNAKPIWPMIKRINQLYNAGHIIYFYTSRHMLKERLTKEWLKKHKVKYHHIFFGKPAGDLYIDDRSMKPDEFLNKSQTK